MDLISLYFLFLHKHNTHTAFTNGHLQSDPHTARGKRTQEEQQTNHNLYVCQPSNMQTGGQIAYTSKFCIFVFISCKFVSVSHHTPFVSLNQSSAQASMLSMYVHNICSGVVVVARVAWCQLTSCCCCCWSCWRCWRKSHYLLELGKWKLRACVPVAHIEIPKYYYVYMYGVLFMCGAFCTKANFNWQPTAVVVAVAQCRWLFFSASFVDFMLHGCRFSVKL